MNVLMTLMKLDIGGVETHVMELATALKNIGVKVFVASNGGVYETFFKKNSIPHFNVPLHNKNPVNIVKAYFLLNKIIRENKIDVVHAHARIPAFVCGLLKKRLKFKFITTAHVVFSTSLLFKILSNWGEKTIAVSEDIKKYLVKNYKINPNNIILTVNGINVHKFADDIDFSSIMQEFELDEKSLKIVYVARLDVGNDLVAHHLVENANYIASICPRPIEIIIVGGGNDFAKVKIKADDVNRKIAKRLLIMTNSRTDVNKFITAADICIGIGRSVLEAMSASKPVIIAGNDGYIGIFDETKLQSCVDTNFTCRGCQPYNVEFLKRDLKQLILSDNKNLGIYAKSIIANKYSPEVMANDNLKVYNSVLTKQNDILISGYYGYENTGDDLLLKAIIENLRALNPNIRMVVLSKTPRQTEQQYDISCLHRFNILKILKTMSNTRLLITGGGNLLQDITSTRSLLYYLFIINTAIKRGAKVMLYANGFGPVVKKFNQKRVRNVLNKIDCITLRETDSARQLEKLNIDAAKIYVTSDPVFSLHENGGDVTAEVLAEAGISSKNQYFCISVREWKSIGRHFEKQIAATIDYVASKYNLLPVFMPMQFCADEAISARIISRMAKECVMIKSTSIEQSLGIIAKAEFVVGMRLHTIIYAAKSGVPIVGLVYDPKVKAMMKYLEQDFYVDIENVSSDVLNKNINEIMKRKNEISRKLKETADIARQKSLYTAQLAIDLIDR